jgi:hypothetical protein
VKVNHVSEGGRKGKCTSYHKILNRDREDYEDQQKCKDISRYAHENNY